MSYDKIIALCKQECTKNNLQFDEDWVHIDTGTGVTTVQNEYGRILVRIDI